MLAVISPAIFTPQAAASVGLLVPPAQRGRAVTFVFLGWSVASVMGMPLSAWIGNDLGWRWAFALVALMSLVSAVWVWREMPNGIRPAALSRKAWGRTLGSSALMLTVGVTLLMSFAQFTLFSYFAPYLVQTLGMGGGALSLMFLWFGAFGFLGNVGLSRWIDQIGAPRAALLMMGAMALSLLLWPLGRLGFWQQALVLVPWAIGCFAANSAQQARLVQPVAGTGLGHDRAQHLGYVRRSGTGRGPGRCADRARPDAAPARGGSGGDGAGDGPERVGGAADHARLNHRFRNARKASGSATGPRPGPPGQCAPAAGGAPRWARRRPARTGAPPGRVACV